MQRLYPAIIIHWTLDWSCKDWQVCLQDATSEDMPQTQAGKEEPLRYNKEDLLNPWFIVEAKREH